jgi:hypothetical protein
VSRHYAHRGDSLIEVRSRDQTPEQFLWRGKLYRVISVLEQWRESGTWWNSPAASGSGSLVDEEREFWRVEAGRGATSGAGIYDLCFNQARGQWSLSSVLD